MLSDIVSKALVRNDESMAEIQEASGRAQIFAREAEKAQSERNAEADRRETERTLTTKSSRRSSTCSVKA